MIVGFSKHGTGSSTGPIQYLTGTQSPDGTLRQPAPVVVRGDPALVGQLIDSLDFTHKYTSGVLSFAPGETITPLMEERIMDAFERVAFAGLERDQYSILWVRHSHAGHHELNFLVPRVELSTGKSLNIAPPGKASRDLFDTFRSMVNAQYGLADPDDPSRAQDVRLPNHVARVRADATRKGKALHDDLRAVITEHVRREVDAGRVKDRGGVEAFLKAQGYTLTRTGKDYLTVLDPTTGDKLRLTGGLYHREQFDPSQSRPQVRYGMPDPDRAAQLAATLERLTATRARYHQTRYGSPDGHDPRPHTRTGPELPGPEEGLTGYVQRTLGEDAITPQQDGGLPARSTQRRQHRQRMYDALHLEDRGGPDDLSGAAIPGRPDAPGTGVPGARARLGAALNRLVHAGHELDAAGRRLNRVRPAFTASVTASLERQWWERYYGGLEPER